MITGTVKEDGHAYVEVKIKGPLRQEYVRVEAMIDTGFSGFLCVPFTKGVEGGLILETYVDIKVADGRVIPHVGCLGLVKIENQGESYEKIGLVILNGDEIATIGQEFLTTNNLLLWLDSKEKRVILIQRDKLLSSWEKQ